MEARKSKVSEREELTPLLKKSVTACFWLPALFCRDTCFTPSSDMLDEYGNGPRLVVLEPSAFSAYSRSSGTNQAFKAAEVILFKRVSKPRVKQNRLFFSLPIMTV